MTVCSLSSLQKCTMHHSRAWNLALIGIRMVGTGARSQMSKFGQSHSIWAVVCPAWATAYTDFCEIWLKQHTIGFLSHAEFGRSQWGPFKISNFCYNMEFPRFFCPQRRQYVLIDVKLGMDEQTEGWCGYSAQRICNFVILEYRPAAILLVYCCQQKWHNSLHVAAR